MSLKKKSTFAQLCNHAPVLRADSNWVKEDGPIKATGNVLKSLAHPGAPFGSFADRADTDADGHVLKLKTIGTFYGQYGILKLNANGTYSYSLYSEAQKPGAYAAVQGLSGGETLTDSFNYKATDGYVTKSSYLKITIFGTDDPVKILDLTPKAEGGDTVVDEDGLAGALIDAGRPGETDANESATNTSTFKIVAPDGIDDLIVGGTAVITNGVFAPVTIATPFGNELKILSFDPATGVVTYSYTLLAPESHPGAGEDSIFESFVVKLTDVDGSSATASLDIRIVDDQPMIEVCHPNDYDQNEDARVIAEDCMPPFLTVDETDLDTDATGSFSSLFLSDYGADGPGTIAFALDTTGDPSGLVDTLSGDPVVVGKEGDDIVGRAGAAGPIVFTISVNAAGDVTLDQQRAVFHDPNFGPNDFEGLPYNLVSLTATITDADGDTASAVLDIASSLGFYDDAPSATDEPAQNVAEGGTIAGQFDFAPGNDGATVTAIDGTVLVFGADGYSQDIDLGVGTIKVKADGTYSFTADNPTNSPVPPINGSFTVTDGDGDPAVGYFTFLIDDANVPAGGWAMAMVDDDGLADGNPMSTIGDLDANFGDDPADTSEATFTGTLGGSVGGDVPGTFSFAALHGTSGTVGLETVDYSWAGNVLTATGPRGPLFHVEVTDPATGAFTVTLLDNVLNAGGPNDEEINAVVNLVYVITDSDGSTANGTLTVILDDDAPEAYSVTTYGQTDDEGKCDFAAISNEGQATPLAGDADVAGSPATLSGPAGTLFAIGADGLQLISIASPAGIKAIYKLASGLPAQEALNYTSAADGSGNVTLTAKGVVTGDTAFELTINIDGSYAFTQGAALVHPLDTPSNEDDLTIPFDFTVTDRDGDTASGTLSVSVDDDTPVGGNVTETVTEVAALTNLMLIVDVSGSMADPSGIPGLTRLQAAQQAMIDLINAYDANGDVVVRIVTFSSNAAEVGSQWMSVNQAITAINGLSPDGFTNYDAAIETAAPGAFVDPGKIAGGQNVSYFLSDGFPNRPVGDEGINAAEEAAWESFVDSNDIVSFSLGMGTGVDQGALNPIAYNGVTNVDTNSVVVTNFTDLSGVLVGTATPTLASGTAAGQFGADGGSFALTDTGAPSGFSYVVSGNTLLVKSGTTTVMTLTLDSLTGAYTVKQNAPIPHTGAGADTLQFVFTLNVVDGDGDGATSTITLNVADTVPTAGTNPNVQLDDDALANGNPGGTGDVSPDTANTSGTLMHSFGADGGSIEWLTNVTTSGGATGFTYQKSGDNLLIKQNGNTVITVALNPATGAYTVTQNAPIKHASGDTENDQSFTLTYRVTDSEGDWADGTLTINADDDTPDAITPDAEVISNKAGQSKTAELDVDGNIDDNVGADLPGTIAFVGIANGQQATGIIDGAAVNLTSGGKLIKLYLSDSDKVLEGWVDGAPGVGTKVFTITLHPDGSLATSNDTYTVSIQKPIDNGAGVVFTNLTGTGPAGNVSFKIVDSGAGLELLFTPGDRDSNTDATGGTVNSDVDDIGISDQWIDPSPDVLRIDYGNFSIVSNQFQIDSHTTVNGGRFQLVQVGGPPGNTVTVKVKAFDANDDENMINDTADTINHVRIYDSNGTTLLADRTLAEGDGSEGGFTFDFQGTSGVSITNLTQGKFVVVDTATGFNRIEIDNVTASAQANDQFSVGGLAVETTNFGDPIKLNYNVGLTDADGDRAVPLGIIDITVVP